ncbi:hypothetical protein R3I93_006482 [Phoxinus phoxinus]|uniref:Uncharacterized protein n=1 Tax=Phoxinus phoxinus TaxID=58324 RepID=A0AAN9HC98_9TELE
MPTPRCVRGRNEWGRESRTNDGKDMRHDGRRCPSEATGGNSLTRTDHPGLLCNTRQP